MNSMEGATSDLCDWQPDSARQAANSGICSLSSVACDAGFTLAPGGLSIETAPISPSV